MLNCAADMAAMNIPVINIGQFLNKCKIANIIVKKIQQG